jgi:DNA repair protein RadA/Sms
VGLAGEIRNVNFIEQRINECSRLGFKKCIIPRRSALPPSLSEENGDIEIIRAGHILQAFNAAFDEAEATNKN